jgi:uncharacterized RDD family membrane protein YckC
MKYLHRAWFYLVAASLLVHVYLVVTLPFQTYLSLHDDPMLGPTFAVLGLFLLTYPYLVLFPLYDVFSKKRNLKLVLICMIIVLPLIGPYIYFEKFIFPTYFRRKTPEEKARDRALFVAVPPETLWRRAAAATIDYGVFILFVFSHIWTFGTPVGENTRVISGPENALLYFAVWFAYFPMAEGIWGKTLGKSLLGLKVVMYTGQKVTFGGALRRHLIDFIDLIFFGFIAIAVTRNGPPRRFGDYWAHTLVVLKAAKATMPTEPGGSTQE